MGTGWHAVSNGFQIWKRTENPKPKTRSIKLTDNIQSKRHRHLRLGVHLTFVNARVPQLWKFDLQRPIIRVLLANYLQKRRTEIELVLCFRHSFQLESFIIHKSLGWNVVHHTTVPQTPTPFDLNEINIPLRWSNMQIYPRHAPANSISTAECCMPSVQCACPNWLVCFLRINWMC